MNKLTYSLHNAASWAFWVLFLPIRFIVGAVYRNRSLRSGRDGHAKSAWKKSRNLSSQRLLSGTRFDDPPTASFRLKILQRCRLLVDLPIEVRRMIYSYAIALNTIHIEEYQDRLVHVTSNPFNQNDQSSPHDCHYFNRVRYHDYCDGRLTGMLSSEHHSHPTNRNDRDGLTNLLLTCRQILSEAIDLLYQKNTFIMHRYTTLLLFHGSLPPERFHSFRSLNLAWDYRVSEASSFPSDYRVQTNWQRAWTILAKLTKLQHLRVEFDIAPYRGNSRQCPLNAQEEEDMFRPAWKVRLAR